jgi:hypothetical protein
MRNLWRALALAWLGGVASPGLADDVLQPEMVIEADTPDDVDEAAERDPDALTAPSDVER